MKIRLSMLVLVLSATFCAADDDKVIHEPYPWPNAEIPSREKPMRRDFSEPLEFGAKYPKPSVAPPEARSGAKAAAKPGKKTTKSRKKPSKRSQKGVSTPELPVMEPSAPIQPHRVPDVPPGYTDKALPEMESSTVTEEAPVSETKMFAINMIGIIIMLLGIAGAVIYVTKRLDNSA
jgi:hypothetical protein